MHFISNSTFLFYTILPIIPLLLLAVLSTDPYLWIGSELHHFFIELFAVVFSGVIGFYYILHARNLDDKFSLFIGIGFSVSAVLDLFHVVVSYSMMEDVEFLKYFIPQTWFAGRIFLSCMLLIGISKYSPLQTDTENKYGQNTSSDKDKPGFIKKVKTRKKEKQDSFNSPSYTKKENLQKNLTLNIVFLAGLAGIIAYTSLFVIYPASFLDEYSLHRPYEIPPMILFSLTLFLFYKKKLYRKNDVVYKGILIYLIVDIFSQVIMSYSTAPFDHAHNIAHVLKDVGYFVNIIALALSGIQYTVALKERNKTIQKQHEKIKESEKIKDEFINVAAHELRTPIQPILALSIFLSGKKGTIEEYQEYIDVIIRSSKRLQKLSEEILDASKIESGSLNIVVENFDFIEVISSLLREFNTKIISDDDIIIRFYWNGKELITDNKYEQTNDNTMYINADKSRIIRVISNLLSNSIRFTKRGVIDVILEKNGEYLTLKIRDNGTGIDENILPRLFDKFITCSPSGTGLGLYISKNIIEAHGGKIWAENNHDSQGATFSFTMPLNYVQDLDIT